MKKFANPSSNLLTFLGSQYIDLQIILQESSFKEGNIYDYQDYLRNISGGRARTYQP
jgi:hypothetical protein